jgi:hypothetical protein
MVTKVIPANAYARAHYDARRTLHGPCAICGAAGKFEAALRPDAPAEHLLLDPAIRCLYSLNPADYFALCTPCHRRLDHVELRRTCRRGHEYTPDNTSLKTDGSRRCLERASARNAKNARDKLYRLRNPMTPEQKARKVALQRLRRQRQNP